MVRKFRSGQQDNSLFFDTKLFQKFSFFMRGSNLCFFGKMKFLTAIFLSILFSIENFYLVKDQMKDNFVLKVSRFVDSGFVKTCDEHVLKMCPSFSLYSFQIITNLNRMVIAFLIPQMWMRLPQFQRDLKIQPTTPLQFTPVSTKM